MAYSSHSAQSNGFLQPAGKGAAPTAHRGVSAPEGCVPSQISWNSFLSLRELSPCWGSSNLGWCQLCCFGQTSDLQLVRDALRSLRNSFSGHDPQHHTIDSLEQGISSLMERLHRMETQKRQERRVKSPQGTQLLPLTCSGREVTLSPYFGFVPQVRGKSPASRASNECRDSWPPKSSKCLADPALPLPNSLLGFRGVEFPWESAPSRILPASEMLQREGTQVYGWFSVKNYHSAGPSLLGHAAAQITMAITGKRDVVPAFLLLCTI